MCSGQREMVGFSEFMRRKTKKFIIHVYYMNWLLRLFHGYLQASLFHNVNLCFLIETVRYMDVIKLNHDVTNLLKFTTLIYNPTKVFLMIFHWYLILQAWCVSYSSMQTYFYILIFLCFILIAKTLFISVTAASLFGFDSTHLAHPEKENSAHKAQ